MAYRIRKKNTSGNESGPPESPTPSVSARTESMGARLSGVSSSRNAWGFAGTILLVLLIGIGVVYHIHSKKVARESAAAALETKAEQLYSQGQQTNGPELVKAKELLLKVMSSYEGTASSRVAPLFLASIINIQTPQDSAKAIEWLHRGLDKNAGNMKLLPFYYESMGLTMMSSRQYDQAIAMFQKVTAFPSKVLADAALYNIGKTYEILDQPALAIINYKKLVSEFPSSPWAAESEPFLMKNGVTPPATTQPLPLSPQK
ncbi:MAG: tetratricopeptide repeat protein [Leptospirales bacterium]|jgi:tetratricopeptide (TPR) repeat protein